MELRRLALAFWETTNDLQTLRLTMDDALEELAAEILRIDSQPIESRKALVSERMRVCSLKSNILATRLNLGGFKSLCHARIDECAPGIFERMGKESRGAFAASERATQGEP